MDLKESSRIVKQLADLVDVALEDAQGVRVRDHHGCDIRRQLRSQVLHVHGTVGPGPHLACLEAREGTARRIRSVGAVGDQDHVPLGVLMRLVTSLDHHERREFAVGPGGGLEADVRQSAHLGEDGLEFAKRLEDPLGFLRQAERVCPREARKAHRRFAEPGIVLHSAGAQRIKDIIDGEVPGREARVVPHHVKLAEAWKAYRPRAPQRGRNTGFERGQLRLGRRGGWPAASRAACFEDGRQVPREVHARLLESVAFCPAPAQTADRASASFWAASHKYKPVIVQRTTPVKISYRQ